MLGMSILYSWAVLALLFAFFKFLFTSEGSRWKYAFAYLSAVCWIIQIVIWVLWGLKNVWLLV